MSVIRQCTPCVPNDSDKCEDCLCENPLSLSEQFNLMRERAAALEHDQWVQWSKQIAATEKISAERLARWQKLWIPYSELSEEQKESDRKWADRGIEIYSSFAMEV